jgi:hypothetical protein
MERKSPGAKFTALVALAGEVFGDAMFADVKTKVGICDLERVFLLAFHRHTAGDAVRRDVEPGIVAA